MLALILLACSKQAPEIKIADNWVRATTEGQEVGAAYMTITSASDTSLVKVESSVTDSVEIHSMSMENGVMKMRMLDELPLKANQPEKLAPGGFHVMLMDLQKPLKVGENVNVRLCFKDKSGKITDKNVMLPVKEN